MPRWLPNVLARVRELVAQGRIRLTGKAWREVVSLGLAPEDVLDVLLCITASDCAGRLVFERTGEWMYVFKPRVGDQLVYVKLIVRGFCVVVSFHADEGEDHEEDS